MSSSNQQNKVLAAGASGKRLLVANLRREGEKVVVESVDQLALYGASSAVKNVSKYFSDGPRAGSARALYAAFLDQSAVEVATGEALQDEPRRIVGAAAEHQNLDPEATKWNVSDNKSGAPIAEGTAKPEGALVVGVPNENLRSAQAAGEAFGYKADNVGIWSTAIAGAIAESITAGDSTEGVVVLEMLEGNSRILFVGKNGIERIARAELGLSALFDQVQDKLNLKFRGSAEKLFYEGLYDFSSVAKTLLEKHASELKQVIEENRQHVTTKPAQLFVVQPLLKRPWLEQHLAGQVGLSASSLQLKPFLSRHKISVANETAMSESPRDYACLLSLIPAAIANKPEEVHWAASSLALTDLGNLPPSFGKGEAPAKETSKAGAPAEKGPAKPAFAPKPAKKRKKKKLTPPAAAAATAQGGAQEQEKKSAPPPPSPGAVEAKKERQTEPAKAPPPPGTGENRSKMPFIIGGAVVLVIILLALVLFTGGEESDVPPPVASTMADDVTRDAVVAEDEEEEPLPEEQEATPAPETEEEMLEPAGAEEPLLPDTGLAEETPEAAEPAAPPPPPPASLAVYTDPANALVTLDGEELGQAPVNLDELEAGTYSLRFSLPGYEEVTREVTLEAGESVELDSVELPLRTGAVDLQTNLENADYSLRSVNLEAEGLDRIEREGTLPADLSDLPVGTYEVTFQRQDWNPQTTRIEITAGETASVSQEFPVYDLTIESEPSGATVQRRGQNLGTTPLELTELPPGTDVLTLVHPEMEPEGVVVNMGPDAPSVVSTTMTPLNKVFDLSDVDLRPMPLEQPTPEIPSRYAGRTVRARVSFVISNSGSVTDVEVVESNLPRLNDLFIDAVNRWRYVPAERRGRPVRTEAQTVFSFN